MDKAEMRKKMGIGSSEGKSFYALNKVTMSGDDGTFKHTDLLTEREKGTKPEVQDLGKTLDGVILKMRWALSKYDEPNNQYYSSTEYDDKWKDNVTVFPNKDKGSVPDMKARYGLSTHRVVYFYVPAKHEVVRLIVKASALTSDKNPNGELGLFQHIDSFMETDSLPLEYITTCFGVFREGTNKDGTKNKRKDHYAMAFKTGRILTEGEQEKMIAVLEEIDTKLGTTATHTDPVEEALDEAIGDGPTPDDIPF